MNPGARRGGAGAGARSAVRPAFQRAARFGRRFQPAARHEPDPDAGERPRLRKTMKGSDCQCRRGCSPASLVAIFWAFLTGRSYEDDATGFKKLVLILGTWRCLRQRSVYPLCFIAVEPDEALPPCVSAALWRSRRKTAKTGCPDSPAKRHRRSWQSQG
jgi:hypothetical protein